MPMRSVHDGICTPKKNKRLPYGSKSHSKYGGSSHYFNTLQGTNISPKKWHFEDDFPFPKVGYVSSLEGMWLYKDQKRSNFR